MMNRKVRVAQYGCGKMAEPTMNFVYDHGGEVVCAFGRSDRTAGKDIGEIMGTENKGVLIDYSRDAREVLSRTKPDVCIVETMSLLPDCQDIFLLCAELGINAISTCEEAFYPWNSRYKMTKEIDELAKKNNCTICGSGAQDMGWGYILSTVAGASNKITKIKGSVVYNSEDYGIALAKVHGVNMSMDEFEKEIASVNDISEEKRHEVQETEDFLPSYMWNANGWICSLFGLTVKTQEQKFIPQICDQPLWSDVLQTEIPAGHATGLSATVITTTEEGITLETECVGKVYAPGEEDSITWTIYGEPDLDFVLKKPDTVAITCASVVNRIPDLINAAPGYITTDKMGPLTHMFKPMNEYVK